jgi:hypothetical protein
MFAEPAPWISRATIAGLYDGFKQNQSLELSASVQKISVIKLRDGLNILTQALDEDTQLKTDKFVRVIIQVRDSLAVIFVCLLVTATASRKLEELHACFRTPNHQYFLFSHF